MILCADDFGLRDEIDEAILELCGLRKLSAVSCMVLFERCSGDRLGQLIRQRGLVDLGLHLCLTPEQPNVSAGAGNIVFSSFANCLGSTNRGGVPRGELVSEIAAQYQMFRAKCGFEPDYIDGHLHIHQAPAVREALVEFVLGLAPAQRPYIRNTYLPVKTLRRQRLPWLKAWLIGRFGLRIARRLQSSGLRTNDGFAGIYDFQQWRRFTQYFAGFIDCLEHRTGILVVHPGKNESWRRKEFETLRDSDLKVALNRFDG
jgi:hypothetical protein